MFARNKNVVYFTNKEREIDMKLKQLSRKHFSSNFKIFWVYAFYFNDFPPKLRRP